LVFSRTLVLAISDGYERDHAHLLCPLGLSRLCIEATQATGISRIGVVSVDISIQIERAAEMGSHISILPDFLQPVILQLEQGASVAVIGCYEDLAVSDKWICRIDIITRGPSVGGKLLTRKHIHYIEGLHSKYCGVSDENST
jgi:hypothetical protein